MKQHELRETLQFISSQQLVCVNQHLYGIYEYLTQAQLESWFADEEVEYVRLVQKQQAVYTQTHHV
ncbi:MAG: hypothetical protein ACRCZG_06735 [Culicoidibacterales bacterium]